MRKDKRKCPPTRSKVSRPSRATAVRKHGNTLRSASGAKSPTGKIAGPELKEMVGEPETSAASGTTSAQAVLPHLRDIERRVIYLPARPDPNERAEHEAFLYGFTFGMEALRRAGIVIGQDIWIDAQQVAFLMYPPFDPPSDIRKREIPDDS